MTLRAGAIDWGFRMFGATGLHRVAQRFTQGLGAILMLHRVRPANDSQFKPNSGLEITPEFLDLALTKINEAGYDLVSLDQAIERMRSGRSESPFLALTFDDGYRDNVEVALPILARHGAPFTIYVTSGFADHAARLWWVELERALARLDHISFSVGGLTFDAPTADPIQKQAAFRKIYWTLRAGPDALLLEATGRLCELAGIDPYAIARELCLGWKGLRALARHPLATIGAHTQTHPMLAKHDLKTVRAEMVESRDRIAAELGATIRHFAYPVGDPTSAGPREFALARELGFASAVTTRPGMIFPEHRDHLTALPRLSVNGDHQNWRALEILLSGAPFMVWNRGRRLSVA